MRVVLHLWVRKGGFSEANFTGEPQQVARVGLLIRMATEPTGRPNFPLLDHGSGAVPLAPGQGDLRSTPDMRPVAPVSGDAHVVSDAISSNVPAVVENDETILPAFAKPKPEAPRPKHLIGDTNPGNFGNIVDNADYAMDDGGFLDCNCPDCNTCDCNCDCDCTGCDCTGCYGCSIT